MNLIVFSSVLNALLHALHAESFADMSFWTEEELYEMAAEAARMLGQTGVLVARALFTITGGNAGYALPPLTLSTIHVSMDGRSLRGINVQELEALNSDWRSASDDEPTHFAADISGLQVVELYPAPTLSGEGALVRHFYPDVGGSFSTVVAPGVCGDFVRYSMLRDCRAKDGDGMMMDVAAHAGERAKLYRAVFDNYWTEAE
jgi:hypothetical protein